MQIAELFLNLILSMNDCINQQELVYADDMLCSGSFYNIRLCTISKKGHVMYSVISTSYRR